MTSRLKLRPGAADDALREFQAQIPGPLPPDYLEFMRWSNGAEGFVGPSYLVLLPVEDVLPRNKRLLVDEFAPGLVIFASDGGGTAYAFDALGANMPIVEVDFIPLERRGAMIRATSFVGFLEFLSGQRPI